MEDSDWITGLVVKSQSGFFWVETDQGRIVTTIPGRLKQTRLNTDIVAIGDQVDISLINETEGLIEAVAPRERVDRRVQPRDTSGRRDRRAKKTHGRHPHLDL